MRALPACRCAVPAIVLAAVPRAFTQGGAVNALPKICRRGIRLGAAALAAAALMAPSPARADEGGTGHYMPGFFGYFGGILPSDRGLYFSNYVNQYSGAVGGNRPIEIGGQVRFGVLTSWSAAIPSFTYMMTGKGHKVLGGNFGMGIAVPVMYVDTSAAA